MVILQCDKAYHRWAILMVRSLSRHEPVIKVYVDTLNLHADEIRELERAHPNITVTNAATAEGMTRRDEMACRKPSVFLRAIDAHPYERWYGLFDVDLLVRRPLPDLWAALDEHQAAVIMTDGYWQGRMYEHLLIPSGLVLIRRDGQTLIESWAKWMKYATPLCNRKPGEWFWDQCTLLQAKRETDLKYACIPMERFADASLSPFSSIWSAHHGDKAVFYSRFSDEYARQHALEDELKAKDRETRLSAMLNS
jgi:hypothetical protein